MPLKPNSCPCCYLSTSREFPSCFVWFICAVKELFMELVYFVPNVLLVSPMLMEPRLPTGVRVVTTLASSIWLELKQGLTVKPGFQQVGTYLSRGAKVPACRHYFYPRFNTHECHCFTAEGSETESSGEALGRARSKSGETISLERQMDTHRRDLLRLRWALGTGQVCVRSTPINLYT